MVGDGRLAGFTRWALTRDTSSPMFEMVFNFFMHANGAALPTNYSRHEGAKWAIDMRELVRVARVRSLDRIPAAATMGLPHPVATRSAKLEGTMPVRARDQERKPLAPVARCSARTAAQGAHRRAHSTTESRVGEVTLEPPGDIECEPRRGLA